MDTTVRGSLARNNETDAPPSAVSAFGIQGVALKPHARVGEQSVESSGNEGRRGAARAEVATQSNVAGRKVSDVIAKYNTAPTWWLSHCNCTPRCGIFTRAFPPPVLRTHVLELKNGLSNRCATIAEGHLDEDVVAAAGADPAVSLCT